MATLPNITRRAAFLGAAASTAALAVATVPVVAKAPEPLADADAKLLHFLATAEDRDIAQYHANQLAKLFQRIKGGAWTLMIDEARNLVLLSGDPAAEHGCIIQNFA